MRSCTVTLVSMLLLSAVAFGDQPPLMSRAPIEVILDFKNHVALVPEGTILTAIPAVSGRFRISKSPASRETLQERERGYRNMKRDDGLHAGSESETSAQDFVPFVFGYAPDEVFAKYRANTQQTSHRIRTNDYYFQFVYYASAPYGCPSCYLTLYVDYTAAPYPADDYTTGFVATSVSGANYFRTVDIESSDGYFNCSNWEEYSSLDLSCSSSDTRHHQVNGTTVTVDTFAEYFDGTNFYDLETCLGCNGGYGYGIENSVHREP